MHVVYEGKSWANFDELVTALTLVNIELHKVVRPFDDTKTRQFFGKKLSPNFFISYKLNHRVSFRDVLRLFPLIDSRPFQCYFRLAIHGLNLG